MFGISSDHDAHVFKRCLELLETLNERTHQMAIDLTALTAAETKLVADVKTLLGVVATLQAGGTTDAATQAAIDAITANLTGSDTAVEAALAPTGSTGVTGATGA